MNPEFRRMQELAGLTEIKINKLDLSNPIVFKNHLDRIPNEKYFYIGDEEADWFNEEELPESYDWKTFDDDWDGDLVDYFYDDIFNNELKGKPGITGGDFYEWIEIDRKKDNTEEGYAGNREIILYNKIKDIITAYKKKHFSNKT